MRYTNHLHSGIESDVPLILKVYRHPWPGRRSSTYPALCGREISRCCQLAAFDEGSYYTSCHMLHKTTMRGMMSRLETPRRQAEAERCVLAGAGFETGARSYRTAHRLICTNNRVRQTKTRRLSYIGKEHAITALMHAVTECIAEHSY